jgi:hypothetical protein
MAEAGGGDRWRRLLRCVAARPEQQARVGATGSPRAGRSSTCWRCKRPEGGARHGHHWRRQWWLGGSAHTRVKDGGKLLKPSSRRWGSFLARKTQGCGMGRGGARVRQRRHRPGGAVGATLPVRAWRVAHGERTGMAVRQGRPTAHGPADQSRPQRAGPAGPRHGRRATLARRRALDAKGQKPFRLASFERFFLKFFQ